MQILVLDCCSLVHAKAMNDISITPIYLIESLSRASIKLYTTPKVYGELSASSLSTILTNWEREGLLSTEAAKRQEVRQITNHLRNNDVEPGNNDKELIALTKRLQGSLLTHDTAAAQLGRRLKLDVLDLVDLAWHCMQRHIIDIEQLDEAWGDLSGYPWPWPNYPWSGSVRQTLQTRGLL